MKQMLVTETRDCALRSASSCIHAWLLVLIDFYYSMYKRLLVLTDF